MTMKCNALALCLIATALLPGFNPAALANPGSTYSLNIAIDGTIMANGSCKFNQGGALTVDFGEVQLQGSADNTVTMNGTYRKPIVSDFTCSGDSAGLLQMKLSNTGGGEKPITAFRFWIPIKELWALNCWSMALRKARGVGSPSIRTVRRR